MYRLFSTLTPYPNCKRLAFASSGNYYVPHQLNPRHQIWCHTASYITVIRQWLHDDVIKWKKNFRVTGHLCGEFTGPPGNSPHKGQWRGALVFSLICVWINGWVNNRDAGDSKRNRPHYDVSVMCSQHIYLPACFSSTHEILIKQIYRTLVSGSSLIMEANIHLLFLFYTTTIVIMCKPITAGLNLWNSALQSWHTHFTLRRRHTLYTRYMRMSVFFIFLFDLVCESVSKSFMSWWSHLWTIVQRK